MKMVVYVGRKLSEIWRKYDVTDQHRTGGGQASQQKWGYRGVDSPVIEYAVERYLTVAQVLPFLQHPLKIRDGIKNQKGLNGGPAGGSFYNCGICDFRGKMVEDYGAESRGQNRC